MSRNISKVLARFGLFLLFFVLFFSFILLMVERHIAHDLSAKDGQSGALTGNMCTKYDTQAWAQLFGAKE